MLKKIKYNSLPVSVLWYKNIFNFFLSTFFQLFISGLKKKFILIIRFPFSYKNSFVYLLGSDTVD